MIWVSGLKLFTRASWKKMRNPSYIILVTLILLGGSLRFYHIDIPGFTEGADSLYANTARTIILLAGWCWDNPDLLFDEQAVKEGLIVLFSEHAHIPYMPYYCKPLYDFLNVIAIAIFGYDDKVLPISSAIIGIVSIVAIFFLGSRLYGRRVGIVAASLLTVSGGGLVFSRYGQAHMWSLFFFMVGFWFYLKSLPPNERSYKSLTACSLFGGGALATHPSLLPYVGLWGGYELLLLLQRRISWRTALQRITLLLGGVVLLGIVLNIPFQVIGHIAGAFFDEVETQLHWPFMTFFEQLPHHFNLVITDESPGLLERLYTYLVVLWAWEGTIVAGAVIAALVLWLRRLREGSFNDIIVFSQLLIPLFFWIISENQAVHRFAAGTLPIVLIITARTLERLGEWIRGRLRWNLNISISALCLLVMLVNLQNNRVIFRAHSAVKEIAMWMRQQRQTQVGVRHPLSWKYYGISPVIIGSDGFDQVRLMAFNRRYVSEEEHEILSMLNAREPVVQAPHLRPGKLLEVEFMQKSLVLKLLEKIPMITKPIRRMRKTVLERNKLRRIEVYDLEPVRQQNRKLF